MKRAENRNSTMSLKWIKEEEGEEENDSNGYWVKQQGIGNRASGRKINVIGFNDPKLKLNWTWTRFGRSFPNQIPNTKWVKQRKFTWVSQFTICDSIYIVKPIISLKEPWQWKEDKLQSKNVPDLILPFQIWNEKIVHETWDISIDWKRLSIRREF